MSTTVAANNEAAGKDGGNNTVEEKKPQQKIVGFSSKSVFKKKTKKTADNGGETDSTNTTSTKEKKYRISTFEISEKDLEIFGTNDSVEQKLEQLNKLGGLEKIIKMLNTHELNGLCLPKDEKYATKNCMFGHSRVTLRQKSLNWPLICAILAIILVHFQTRTR